MAAADGTFLALRGSKGIWAVNGPADLNAPLDLIRENSPDCRLMTFSADGSLFAWTNGDSVNVMQCNSGKIIFTFERQRVTGLTFSPRGTLLASLEQYRVDSEMQTGRPNLNIWHIQSGECVHSCVQKKQLCWQPQWTKDEAVCARVINNELQFYEQNSFERYVHKLHIQKVSEFQLSPSPKPYSIVVYVPGTKGQPSYVRLFQYPIFGGPNTALANRSFYRADRISMHWNAKGTAVICVTTVEASEASYYGDQGIFYVDVKGESMRVGLSKNGPVYHVQWNPCQDEFCVVYGFMPAKASLFNGKCEEIFDFGTGHRNLVYYNAFGNLLCLCGFGNLRGNMEFWDTKKRQLVVQTRAEDSTHLSWCPDGETVITATTAPRLRIGNGYKLWHYTGSLLDACSIPVGTELWEVQWQPALPGSFHEPIVQPRSLTLTNHSNEKSAYLPPQIRDNPARASRTRVIPGLNIAPDQVSSKNAERNKKKRDAKKAKRKPDDEPSDEGDTFANDRTISTGSDPEMEKRIRFINKKLKQIEKLKEEQRSGKSLDSNQMEKVRSEKALISELKSLSLQ